MILLTNAKIECSDPVHDSQDRYTLDPVASTIPQPLGLKVVV